jgi:hypothetical protein
MKKAALLLFVLAGFTVQILAQQIPRGLEFEIVDRTSVTITLYMGNATTLNIPAQIRDLPVTAIRKLGIPWL